MMSCVFITHSLYMHECVSFFFLFVVITYSMEIFHFSTMELHIDFLKCLFFLLTFSVLVGGLLVNFFESVTPAPLVQAMRYGKFAYKGPRSLITYLEVPKSWFKHFYIVSTIYSTFVLILAFKCYWFSQIGPQFLRTLLNIISSNHRKTTIDATSCILALLCLTMQTWKRLYETFFISVYSDSKINIAHYLIGIIHYIGAVSAVIIEAPLFSITSYEHKNYITLTDITWRSVVGVGIFLWAWYHQLKAARILGNLRKDEKGSVVTYDHKLPAGDLFDTISSPHLFCEMLMYLAIYIILWGHTTWPFVFLWVFCNQCETALLSHWWYQSNFETYPKNRRAFIPFVL